MFAALANAGSEGLKVGIGVIGLATASVWFNRLRNWTAEIKEADKSAARSLSLIFMAAWTVVTIAHLYFGSKFGFMRS
jgi:hypothetical protein